MKKSVPVVELDTIRASDAPGPGSSPGGHTIIKALERCFNVQGLFLSPAFLSKTLVSIEKKKSANEKISNKPHEKIGPISLSDFVRLDVIRPFFTPFCLYSYLFFLLFLQHNLRSCNQALLVIIRQFPIQIQKLRLIAFQRYVARRRRYRLIP